MNRNIVHAVFIVGVVAIGLAVGYFNMPGEWYRALAKPAFNPPDWIFAPVWTVLYILIGRVGARVYLTRGEHPNLFNLWAALMILNLLWSPAFFGLHLPVLALAIILLLFIGIFAFIRLAWQRDRVSAGLFVPYALWVGFAMVLNAAIVYLN